MRFYVRHRYGGNDRDPPSESFGALLDEVDEDPSDQEHSISAVHESDWAVAVYPGWRVIRRMSRSWTLNRGTWTQAPIVSTYFD